MLTMIGGKGYLSCGLGSEACQWQESLGEKSRKSRTTQEWCADLIRSFRESPGPEIVEADGFLCRPFADGTAAVLDLEADLIEEEGELIVLPNILWVWWPLERHPFAGKTWEEKWAKKRA